VHPAAAAGDLPISLNSPPHLLLLPPFHQPHRHHLHLSLSHRTPPIPINEEIEKKDEDDEDDDESPVQSPPPSKPQESNHPIIKNLNKNEEEVVDPHFDDILSEVGGPEKEEEDEHDEDYADGGVDI